MYCKGSFCSCAKFARLKIAIWNRPATVTSAAVGASAQPGHSISRNTLPSLPNLTTWNSFNNLSFLNLSFHNNFYEVEVTLHRNVYLWFTYYEQSTIYSVCLSHFGVVDMHFFVHKAIQSSYSWLNTTRKLFILTTIAISKLQS